MTKPKRNVWQEMMELGRRLAKELDDLLDAKAGPPLKPARAPVPARKRRAAYKRD